MTQPFSSPVNTHTFMTNSTSRLLVGVLMSAAVVIWGMPAAHSGNVDCTFVADPETQQFRGSDIRLVGSFSDHPNRDFAVGLFTNIAAFPPQGHIFDPPDQPHGTTNQTGFFDVTVTVRSDIPPGDYQLGVLSPVPGQFLFRACFQPYTVIQPLVAIPLPPGGFATPTTSPPTTAPPAPTTTMAPAPSTTAPPAPTTTAEATTTTIPASATTVPVSAESTTTIDEAVLAGEETEGTPGLPVWAIALIAALGLAVVGMGGYLIGQRGRAPTAGIDPNDV